MTEKIEFKWSKKGPFHWKFVDTDSRSFVKIKNYSTLKIDLDQIGHGEFNGSVGFVYKLSGHVIIT